jgi:hypothetical protein
MRCVLSGPGVKGWLLLLGLATAPAWAAPSTSRPRVSANGLYTITFAQQGPGQCLLTVSKEDGPLWSLSRCVGSPEDAFFVSNDGGQFWVLHAVPRVPSGHRYQQHPERWGKVVVAVRFDRTGTVLERRTLASFVTVREREKLVDLGLRFGWLAGVGGAPGVAPRQKDGGVVVLDTVANRQYRLGF